MHSPLWWSFYILFAACWTVALISILGAIVCFMRAQWHIEHVPRWTGIRGSLDRLVSSYVTWGLENRQLTEQSLRLRKHAYHFVATFLCAWLATAVTGLLAHFSGIWP